MKKRRILSLLLTVAMVFSIMPVIALPVSAASGDTFQWSVFPADADISDVGTEGNSGSGHVLKLDNIGLSDANLPFGSATLNFDFQVAHNAERRILVWTDLSGSEDEIEDIPFAATENILAGRVVVSDVFFGGTTESNIQIPKGLLYDGETYANTIYVMLGINKSPIGIPGASDNYTEAAGNRGGNARNGVNGVDLAREFDIFETVTLTLSSEYILNTAWTINPADVNVSRQGEGNHVLKLSNLGFEKENLPEIGGVLEVNYIEGQNSNRRYVAWTDLSGDADEIGDITFATPENLADGKIVRSASVVPAGTTAVELPIPQELLYDEDTDTYATEIYLLLTTDSVDDMQTPGGNRGAAEFVRFDSITLKVTEPPQFATYISLNPGANPSEIGFTWWTEKDTASTTVLQLAKASDVSNKEMPADAKEFTGTRAYAAYGFDVNRVMVTGLEKNTEYAYRLGNGSEWTKIYTFKTYDPDGKYNVIAVADPQISSGDGRMWRASLEKAVAQAGKMGGASFLMSAGDQINKHNSMIEMDEFLSPPELKGLPVMVTVGNHDTDDEATGAAFENVGLLPLVYNWPNYNNLAGIGAEKEIRGGGDYYFSYGNTLYISINSNVREAENHDAFIAEAVASHPDATWKIALFHHDIYGTGPHAGVGFGDSANLQETWSPMLDKYGIDLAVNGHDHVYARSKFYKDDTYMKNQMPAVLDIDEKGLFKPNAGTYVQPDGILYMGLASPTNKTYVAEVLDWVAFTSPRDTTVGEYSIITVEGGDLTFSVYRTDGDDPIDSITLRKKAQYDDLQTLIPGCEEVKKGGITDATWNAFLAEIVKAKAVEASASADAIHAAYVALYNAYYALDPNTDKEALGELLAKVKQTLDTATEGKWEGQYPFGSREILRGFYNEAFAVYDFRLSLQSEIDAAYALLAPAYEEFLASVSDIPRPWIDVHEIKADELYTMDLINWMDDSEVFFWGNNPQERYRAHHTKAHFAGGEFIANDYILTGSSFGLRTESPFGPASDAGGRGSNNGHITKTHVGEWIRYELKVEKAGSYKIELGAINNQAADMTILLRDQFYNTLATFVVPAGHGADGEWEDAALIEADKEIYLPKGHYIVELLFLNNGVAVGNSFAYTDGADVDVLTFERTGDMAVPGADKDPSIFLLPLQGTAAAGTAHRQQGWAAPNHFDEEWGLVGHGVTTREFKAATHLILECAAKPTAANLQLAFGASPLGWIGGQDIAINSLWDEELSALVFELAEMRGYDDFIKNPTRMIISYYSQAYDELNVTKAYLILDTDLLNPVAGFGNLSASKAYDDRFTDMGDYGEWISKAYQYDIIKGATDTAYGTEDNMLIQDAIIIAAKIHAIYNTGAKDIVTGGAKYPTDYIQYAFKHGIIDNRFHWRYDTFATRGELAYIWGGILPDAEMARINTYTAVSDVSADHEYYEEIKLFYEAGIVVGVGGDAFAPDVAVTRGECATMFVRIVSKADRSGSK